MENLVADETSICRYCRWLNQSKFQLKPLKPYYWNWFYGKRRSLQPHWEWMLAKSLVTYMRIEYNWLACTDRKISSITVQSSRKPLECSLSEFCVKNNLWFVQRKKAKFYEGTYYGVRFSAIKTIDKTKMFENVWRMVKNWIFRRKTFDGRCRNFHQIAISNNRGFTVSALLLKRRIKRWDCK